MNRIVSEDEFRDRLRAELEPYRWLIRSVSGPGRSGAVASVYASHFLGVPWIPALADVPESLRPHLAIDTASRTGATLRKHARRVKADASLFLYDEPPIVRFWYERRYSRSQMAVIA